MICFEEKDGMVLKYQVTFDVEAVDALYREIIDNCSFIRPKKVENEKVVMPDDRIVKNYRTKDGKIFFDEYDPCVLASLVARLLVDDSRVYGELLNYEVEKSPLSRINSEIEYEESMMWGRFSSSTTTQEKSRHWNNREKLLKLKEINKNQKSTKEYYEALMSQLNFELVDQLSLEEINRVQSFFEVEFIKGNKGITFRKTR